MPGTAGFVEGILASPLGAALLARVEPRACQADGRPSIGDASVERVEAAVGFVGSMSFGELVELVTCSSVIDVGPWMSEAPGVAARAYRDASIREPIAAAVEARFGEALHRGLDATTQQWWTTGGSWRYELAPLFRDFERVYDAGQFTWAGLWTVSDPPAITHAQLVDAWEMHGGPVTRWHLPVKPGARVFEVDRPDDWARLVLDHPRPAAAHGECWELPGINQDAGSLTALMAIPGQRAARTTIRSHLVPDWRSVAEDYDAVHLSWAGLITAEGCITDLGGGDVAMLRYWFSERTLWLADAFAEPEAMPPPFLPDERLSDGSPANLGIDELEERRSSDRTVLDALLGRLDGGRGMSG